MIKRTLHVYLRNDRTLDPIRITDVNSYEVKDGALLIYCLDEYYVFASGNWAYLRAKVFNED